jgi:hypothetical protein
MLGARNPLSFFGVTHVSILRVCDFSNEKKEPYVVTVITVWPVICRTTTRPPTVQVAHIILRGEALRRIGVCEDVATMMMMASSKPSASMLRPRGPPLRLEAPHWHTRGEAFPARPSGFLRAESTFPRCTLLLRKLVGRRAKLTFRKLPTDHPRSRGRGVPRSYVRRKSRFARANSRVFLTDPRCY